MNRWGAWMSVVMVAMACPGAVAPLACSSEAFPEAGDGGGQRSSVGGRQGSGGTTDNGTGGAGGISVGPAPVDMGEMLTCPMPAPDDGVVCPSTVGLAIVTTCTRNCCSTCGIDLKGTFVCLCPKPGEPYPICVCVPPPEIPQGLMGGPCSPQGYSTAVVPAGAPAGSVSLKGVSCSQLNAVCFTAESTQAAETGCICMPDNTMHCGKVADYFANNLVPTTYN